MGILEGKIAIITGSARGQGEAAARRFVEEGARVVIADVIDDLGKQLTEELGPAAEYRHLDVSSEQDWDTVVGEVMQAHGRLDVLVNNAGILHFSALADTTLADFERLVRVNQVGTFLGMRAAARVMGRGGSIVNLSSTEGLGATLFCGSYTASKFAVRGITKVAALENGKAGIRVNSVHPGGIDTPMTRAVVDDEGRKYIASRVAGLKRMGEADEVAKVIVFLASDASSYMTGAELAVDGGATASAGF